jgi:hypothetical protein
MTHDDYYFFDPYWDDTRPSEDDLCPTCWQTEAKCPCDDEDFDLDDFDL